MRILILGQRGHLSQALPTAIVGEIGIDRNTNYKHFYETHQRMGACGTMHTHFLFESCALVVAK